jgi:hypothetical protein
MLNASASRRARGYGRFPFIGALVVLLAGGAAGAVPTAASAAPSSCLVPGAAKNASNALSSEWLETDSAQQGARLLEAELAKQFGVSGKLDRTAALERGLIGTAIDHSTQSLVVVVDKAKVDLTAAGRKMAAAAPGVTNRLQAGCASTAKLVAAEKVLYNRSWHPDAAKAAFSYHLDPADSTYHVTLDPSDGALADALKRQLGELVTVESGVVKRLDRLNDSERHWGGAGIGTDPDDPICTAAFSVVQSNGARASVTAAHCFIGLHPYSAFSGDYFYGQIGPHLNYPLYDMLLLTGSTYTNGLWVDPCCPSLRYVTSSWDVGVGNVICTSGMTMRALCGHTVRNTNATACQPAGCTPGVIMFNRKPGYCCSVKPGDSGGPLYTRSGSENAAVHGMIIAGNCGAFGGCETGYAEKLVSIRGYLSVSVLTVP